MSPEQARDTTLDGRSDLFSLGLMFYEMLTGTHPRRNLSNTAILGMLAAEEKAPPLVFPPSVPTEVQAVVKDLLRYRPVERIEDAHKLLRRLESLQALGNAVPSSLANSSSVATDQTICELGETPVTPTLKKPARQPEGSSRSSNHIVTIVLVIAAVAGGGAGLYALFSSSQPERPISSDLMSKPVTPAESAAPPITALATPREPVPVSTPPPPASKATPALPKPALGPTAAPSSPKATPAQPRPASPVPLPPPIETARLMKSDQGGMELLDQLRRLVAEKNLAALNEISVMSEGRRLTLETLFANYSTIEASFGEIVSTPTELTTVLRIDKLVLLNGESVPPGSSLRKIRITVPREGDGWGQIVW
jgi:serine/threonine protein kinase